MAAMQNTRISDLKQRTWLGGVVALAVVLGSLATAAPAQAASFSARVGAIVHNAGEVTITGTGDAGDLVSISPSDGEPVDTRVKPDGSWRVKAHVDGFGDHTFEVAASGASRPTTLHATTRRVAEGIVGVVRDERQRWATVNGTGLEPRARIDVELDGVLMTTTATDRDGAFAHRINGVPFGTHRVTVTERFDGAEQFRRNVNFPFEPYTIVDEVRVDPIARVVHLQGTGPITTEMRFVDESGAPWSLTDGQDWVTNTDGTWSADLAYPAPGVRFMGIIAQVYDAMYETPRFVGSTTTGATIPFPVTATVAKSTPKQLVLTGSAEPGARLSFTDADGSPVTDGDGNAVEPSVPGSSEWRVTLDPRRMTGGTVTVSATGDDGPLGSVTLTYR